MRGQDYSHRKLSVTLGESHLEAPYQFPSTISIAVSIGNEVATIHGSLMEDMPCCLFLDTVLPAFQTLATDEDRDIVITFHDGQFEYARAITHLPPRFNLPYQYFSAFLQQSGHRIGTISSDVRLVDDNLLQLEKQRSWNPEEADTFANRMGQAVEHLLPPFFD